MCVISRYDSIAPAPATPHTAPTAPEFSVLSGGLSVRGFYIIMLARCERVKYRYIEFFVLDYDSFPISFQSGITFLLVALDKI